MSAFADISDIGSNIWYSFFRVSWFLHWYWYWNGAHKNMKKKTVTLFSLPLWSELDIRLGQKFNNLPELSQRILIIEQVLSWQGNRLFLFLVWNFTTQCINHRQGISYRVINIYCIFREGEKHSIFYSNEVKFSDIAEIISSAVLLFSEGNISTLNFSKIWFFQRVSFFRGF